jgi:hypothetical protein
MSLGCDLMTLLLVAWHLAGCPEYIFRALLVLQMLLLVICSAFVLRGSAHLGAILAILGRVSGSGRAQPATF